MKNKKYDFLFVYEVKNRELDSICLLRTYLEMKGYTVAFLETWDQQLWRRPLVKADVIVTFALYNDDTIEYISQFVSEGKKIVNLQWEQIFTNAITTANKGENELSGGIYGKATEAFHVSWGHHNYDRIVSQFGVSPSNAYIGGCISLDYLRPEFHSFFLDKCELEGKYNLPKGKKCLLFISSFSYVGLPQQLLSDELYNNQGFDITDFVDVSCKSQKTVLQWFSQFLRDNEDYYIIYRPHPAEANNPEIEKMSKEINRFFTICDYSLKQWVLIADKVYGWWTTGAAEVYAAKKPYGVLRPMKLPWESDLEFYAKCKFIESYEEFVASIPEETFPIPACEMHQFFDIEECPSYIRVGRFLIEVLEKNVGLAIPYKHVSVIKEYYLNMRKYITLSLMKSYLGKKIFVMRNGIESVEATLKMDLYTREMYKKNHSSEREIKEIMKKIRGIVSID